MSSVAVSNQTFVAWQPQLEADALVRGILTQCCDDSPAIRRFADRLRDETGTRLWDWIDHFVLSADEQRSHRLEATDFVYAEGTHGPVWQHPGALLPAVAFHESAERRVVIAVESVADFLAAEKITDSTIEGPPLSPLRKARASSESGVELWVVERHGRLGWEPCDQPSEESDAVVWHRRAFQRRERLFGPQVERFEQTSALVRDAIGDLGVDCTCDLFFAAEREYWTSRNRAARVQKARQGALGLGWGNHDHHTYRSSRQHFARLVAVLEELGLECRERFYAGREAGWGAQVLEQPRSGIVVFADVDLAADEVAEDFAHRGLSPSNTLGTVGLWSALHGEAFLEAGMHHLECRFDFDAVRRQLLEAGIHTMMPFTDLAYLKQAFTEGETWPVNARRVEAAQTAGLISGQQAEQFLRDGAIGSHLELLQRDQGYKGFNQSGISEIITRTDPRRPDQCR